MNSRTDAIARIVTQMNPALGPLTEHLLSGVDDAELEGRSANDIAEAFVSHYGLAMVRLAGTSTVAVQRPGMATQRIPARTPSTPSPVWSGERCVVQVVTDDMPFLVDSVSMAIRRAGFDVELLLHPGFRVERNVDGMLQSIATTDSTIGQLESFMQLELNRPPSESESAQLLGLISVALSDVRAAVADWQAMQTRVTDIASDFRVRPKELSASWKTEPNEAASFLDWLLDDSFTFLGAIDHDLVENELVERAGSALGILRRHPGGTPVEQIIAPSSDWLADDVILVTKTLASSKVHRAGNYDIIVMKRYDPAISATTPVGERRIVGLFTSEAYLQSPQEIPLLRGKISTIVGRSSFAAGGHSAKELKSILVTHPRDELFATPVDELERIAYGILSIGERRRTRVFPRYDAQRSAWSCQVYMPRDRYTTDIRQRVQRRLEERLGATSSTHTTQLSDSRLARIVFTLPSSATTTVEIDDLEEAIVAATQSWEDTLFLALTQQSTQSTADRSALASRYRNAFPPAYTAETPIGQAVEDVESAERALVEDGLYVRMHRLSGEDEPISDARLSLYSPNSSLALADLLPILTNLGLRVIDEKADEIALGGCSIWIHDLGVCAPSLADFDPSGPLAERVCDAVKAVLGGDVDNDSFNQLVTTSALTWRETNVLRFFARHSRQLGLSASLDYIAATLLEHREIASNLSERFTTKFQPTEASEPLRELDERRSKLSEMDIAFDALVSQVPSLEHDRIFRMMSTQIDAAVRTNAFQTNNRVLAVKFETRRIPSAPQPRPMFEIFVSSPEIEGVHLRMGQVARGGLRWSDRPEDFRTEVLGLMKAQAVKNAVIVPAGAKGGFVVRKPSSSTDRSVVQAQGVACYQAFIGALLSLTDNRGVGEEIISPQQVIRWDGDDPYLVVAADKGTATFSDIANAISLERGHWLGDAFASGGSVGYDHKAMGITARGAWESVKRHFLRMGRDITAPQAETFTVAGIGDMSGDVFGNGMLLSNRIALVAAFDHRHIFIDPSPDTSVSFAERQRLFSLPRSSWEDYDVSLISAGGGVWPRSAKSITFSEQAAGAVGLAPEASRTLTPTEILAAILRSPVDLMWNGGIGTYVKSSTETHLQVGDKANDQIRADATELRCKVVGEGGNLGFTQRGRIEAARVGIWINTDAIDNSAGVDTSDHEVNIKILVDRMVTAGVIQPVERNPLLASLTDEIAEQVLGDNVCQNLLLGNLLSESPGMIDLHARYVADLELEGRLDRALEALPGADQFATRRSAGSGLCIPELAVLVAHTKLALSEDLVDAKLAQEPAFQNDLRTYFPQTLVNRLGDHVLGHPLANEIVATVLSNKVVNRNGITFVYRMAEETHASTVDIVRAHSAASAILQVDQFWDEVTSPNGTITDSSQVQLLLEADRAVERTARWLLRNRTLPLDVDAAVAAYAGPISELEGVLDGVADAVPTHLGAVPVSGSDAEALQQRRRRFEAMGVRPAIARQAAHFEFATSLLDVISLVAGSSALETRVVAEVLFGLDDLLSIGVLRRRILRLPRDDQWDGLARSALRDDLGGEHLVLTKSVLQTTSSSLSPVDRVKSWMAAREQPVKRHLDLVRETETIKGSQLAALSVVLRQLRTLSSERIK